MSKESGNSYHISAGRAVAVAATALSLTACGTAVAPGQEQISPGGGSTLVLRRAPVQYGSTYLSVQTPTPQPDIIATLQTEKRGGVRPTPMATYSPIEKPVFTPTPAPTLDLCSVFDDPVLPGNSPVYAFQRVDKGADTCDKIYVSAADEHEARQILATVVELSRPISDSLQMERVDVLPNGLIVRSLYPNPIAVTDKISREMAGGVTTHNYIKYGPDPNSDAFAISARTETRSLNVEAASLFATSAVTATNIILEYLGSLPRDPRVQVTVMVKGSAAEGYPVPGDSDIDFVVTISGPQIPLIHVVRSKLAERLYRPKDQDRALLKRLMGERLPPEIKNIHITTISRGGNFNLQQDLGALMRGSFVTGEKYTNPRWLDMMRSKYNQ